MPEYERPAIKPETMAVLRRYASQHGLSHDEAIQDLLADKEIDTGGVSMQDQIDELKADRATREEVAQLREDMQATNDRVDQIVEKLNGDYWQQIIDEIERRT